MLHVVQVWVSTWVRTAAREWGATGHPPSSQPSANRRYVCQCIHLYVCLYPSCFSVCPSACFSARQSWVLHRDITSVSIGLLTLFRYRPETRALSESESATLFSCPPHPTTQLLDLIHFPNRWSQKCFSQTNARSSAGSPWR